MRYYNFALNGNSEQIKENTTINLQEYAYENTISAMNNREYCERMEKEIEECRTT